ncbi:glycosyl hydrolase family 17 protein, partial [Schleiferiaceae bacterium]|nr:glycosyl hydrolase family 17 protein [Schleiferiaceae bacterium]
LKIMSAMGIKILRTYNLQLAHAPNVLKAIRELKNEDPTFEMYVMLGVWIDCLNAWTDHPDHSIEDPKNNESEIQKAVRYATEYPDIVKVIAVGNEAMVHWASSYFVHPSVILKYVNYLQELKKVGKLAPDLWITSSDNFASWGGGESDYHLPELEALVKAVDYVSAHTYPFHDTHYNSAYWESPASDEEGYSDHDRVLSAMQRAAFYAQGQYESVKSYVHGIDPEKPIHIGETGWSSVSVGFYGNNGSFAADEYKQALYHQAMREWTDAEGISCFYFEAFDEQWKDPNHTDGSENHFGLITLDGKAKFALWESVDNGDFEGLLRGGNPITKTFGGDTTAMLQTVSAPKRRR